MELRTLTVDEIAQIYEILVRDFAEAADPIAPAGVRDRGLLESAVMRQHTGLGAVLKYPTAVLNAASLCYGLCCDHPFHNGNKRTALVALLVHLDRNDLCLPAVTQDQLYELMIAVAGHTLVRRDDRRRMQGSHDADLEVAELARWLRKRTEKITKGERPITYRQLRRILTNYGYTIEVSEGNSADLVRYEEIEKGLFFKKKETKRRKIATIGYRDEGTVVGRSDLRQIRKAAKLREEDGVDSTMFYSTGEVIDTFVNRYRRVLRRLARV